MRQYAAAELPDAPPTNPRGVLAGVEVSVSPLFLVEDQGIAAEVVRSHGGNLYLVYCDHFMTIYLSFLPLSSLSPSSLLPLSFLPLSSLSPSSLSPPSPSSFSLLSPLPPCFLRRSCVSPQRELPPCSTGGGWGDILERQKCSSCHHDLAGGLHCLRGLRGADIARGCSIQGLLVNIAVVLCCSKGVLRPGRC